VSSQRVSRIADVRLSYRHNGSDGITTTVASGGVVCRRVQHPATATQIAQCFGMCPLLLRFVISRTWTAKTGALREGLPKAPHRRRFQPISETASETQLVGQVREDASVTSPSLRTRSHPLGECLLHLAPAGIEERGLLRVCLTDVESERTPKKDLDPHFAGR
jgi:hypothetical protein